MAEYIERTKALTIVDLYHGPRQAYHQIRNLPAADVAAVVHAKWHDVYLVEPWIATGICSRCDTKSYVNPDYPFALRCPNCGAHMKDGE